MRTTEERIGYMADLGTDSGQATLNLSARALELIAKLLDKIFKFIENHPERKRAMLEYKIAKSRHSRELALRKIDGKVGITTYENMKATGKPLDNVEVRISKEDMKMFSDIAKRYDLTFCGLEVKGSNEKEIMIFREDLEKFERAHARFTNEKTLNEIQAKIDELREKGYENLSDEEKEVYNGLLAEKEHLIDQATEQFNTEMSESILKDAVLDDEGNLKKMDLEEGLNRLTGYNLSKPDSGDFVIADAVNPGNYIKVHGFDDTFTNEKGESIKYVRSQYEVYKNNELIKTFDDKRFQGRPKGYWKSIREEMNTLLDKPKYFYKFKTQDVYKVWADDVTKQNEQLLNNNTIESLKEELKSNGYDYKDGNAVLDHELKGKNENIIPKGQAIDEAFIRKIIRKGDLTTLEQNLDFREAFLISQAIQSLEKSNIIENEMGIKNAEIAVEDDPEKKEALEKEYAELEAELKTETDNIEAIQNERKKVNAGQSERNVNNGIAKDENARADSRAEHIKENAQTHSQMSMNDWKSMISDFKAKLQTLKNVGIGNDNPIKGNNIPTIQPDNRGR